MISALSLYRSRNRVFARSPSSRETQHAADHGMREAKFMYHRTHPALAEMHWHLFAFMRDGLTATVIPTASMIGRAVVSVVSGPLRVLA